MKIKAIKLDKLFYQSQFVDIGRMDRPCILANMNIQECDFQRGILLRNRTFLDKGQHICMTGKQVMEYNRCLFRIHVGNLCLCYKRLLHILDDIHKHLLHFFPYIEHLVRKEMDYKVLILECVRYLNLFKKKRD